MFQKSLTFEKTEKRPKKVHSHDVSTQITQTGDDYTHTKPSAANNKSSKLREKERTSRVIEKEKKKKEIETDLLPPLMQSKSSGVRRERNRVRRETERKVSAQRDTDQT